MAARGKLSVNRGGSARGGYRVETVILAALADRCRLWIRRGCQATTGTGSSKRDRGSAGCWSLRLVAGLILPELAGTNSGRRWSESWRLVDRTPLAPIRLVRIWFGGIGRYAPVIRQANGDINRLMGPSRTLTLVHTSGNYSADTRGVQLTPRGGGSAVVDI